MTTTTKSEIDELKNELQKITHKDNYNSMIDRITKWSSLAHQIYILKFIVYHYQIAKALLKGNYKAKNNIDVSLRIALMTQHNQIMNDFISQMIGLGSEATLLRLGSEATLLRLGSEATLLRLGSEAPVDWHKYDEFRHLPRQHLGSYKPDMIHQVATELKENGYAIFPRLLETSVCDRILAGVSNLKYYAKYQEKYIDGIQLDNPIGISHWVDDQREIFYLPEIQELLRDPVLLSICQLYLQTIPINIQTNFWWSVRNNNIGKKDSSHMFHQDQDDIKFIKIFIYLNDVTKDNGPHVYVNKSIHNRSRMPKGYKISNRLSDDWVKSVYGEEAITQVTGPKGTILFGNTNSIHKGCPLAKGYRYLLQLEFGCSLSWFENNPSDLQKTRLQPEMNQFMDKHPIIFLKYRRL